MATATMVNNKYTVQGFVLYMSFCDVELLCAALHIRHLSEKIISQSIENSSLKIFILHYKLQLFFKQNFKIFSGLIFWNVKMPCFKLL